MASGMRERGPVAPQVLTDVPTLPPQGGVMLTTGQHVFLIVGIILVFAILSVGLTR
jgi:hypothetical protein